VILPPASTNLYRRVTTVHLVDEISPAAAAAAVL
jgi:hypothetical protein